jgi:hypothetical protein
VLDHAALGVPHDAAALLARHLEERAARPDLVLELR